MSALLAQKRNKATSLGDSSDNPVMTLLQEAVDVHFAVIKVHTQQLSCISYS